MTSDNRFEVTTSNKFDSYQAQSCIICGYHNPAETETCLNCGVELEVICQICETKLPAGSKFCGQCGARLSEEQTNSAGLKQQEQIRKNFEALMPATLAQKISAASSEMFGELREVTILSLSLLPVAGDVDQVDDEELYLLRHKALRLLIEVIYNYEGMVDKFTENGMVALFGAPVTHENDPARAVRAALDLQSALQAWQTQVQQDYGLDFQLRIGLNTGLVIAGKIGSDLHMDYTVIGATVELAAGLEIAAMPGTIVISVETYRHIHTHFECKALSPLTIGTPPESVDAFQVVRPLEIPQAGSPLFAFKTPMIGRIDEFVRLQRAINDVKKRGQSRIVTVSGDAGIGKSRLVAEFYRSPALAGLKGFQGSAATYVRSAPLRVVSTILRDIIGVSEAIPQTKQLELLDKYLHQHNFAQKDLLPYLAHVLGIEQAKADLAERLKLLEPGMLQRQTHAALRQILLTEASEGPVVLILEDLQWMDPASKDFIDYLVDTTTDVPLLLVLISRLVDGGVAGQFLLDLTQRQDDRSDTIQLKPLLMTETQQLVDHFITQNTSEANKLKQQIVVRSGGNPLYVEEIVRMLTDHGGLVRKHSAGSWQVTSGADELVRGVPGTVKGLILSRFDRLPERTRTILHKAAVLGTSFPVSLLVELGNEPLEILSEHLTELERRQFLRSDNFRSEPGFTFCHGLTQETIYGTLLTRDRRTIHMQAAKAIEQSVLWLAEEQVELLAYHFAESDEKTRAIPYLIAAAENAARRSANILAIEHYSRAMEIMPDQTQNPSDEYFQISTGLGTAYKFVGEYAAGSQILQEALDRIWLWHRVENREAVNAIRVELLHQLGDLQQRAGNYDQALAHLESGLRILGRNAAENNPRAWRLLLDRMAWIRFRQGQLDDVLILANQAISGLEPDNQNDPGVLASLHNTLGGVLWQQGQLDAAISHVYRSLQLYESIGYLWGMAMAYINLGVLSFVSGRWSQANEYFEQAYAIHHQIGGLEGQALSADNLGILYIATGDHEAARQELEAALAIRLRLGDPWGLAQSRLNLARLQIIQEDIEAAAEQAKEALELGESIQSSEVGAEGRAIMALILAEKGELSNGLRLASEGLDMARAVGAREKEIDALRVLGVIKQRLGQQHEAINLLQLSMQLSQEKNDPYRHGLALFELGRTYLAGADGDGDKQAKAWNHLNLAAEKFSDLNAAYDLKLTQTMLEQIEW